MSKKKRCAKKHDRKNEISFENRLPANQSLMFRYDKGKLLVADENGVPFDLGLKSMVRSYQGERKKRIIAKATKLEYVTDHVGSWTDNFSYVFAIDTNTYPQKCYDYYCSVGFVYYAEIKWINDYERNMSCKPYMMIDWYHAEKTKIETITWTEVIKKLQESIPADKKVGIVVDSELGNLEGYNNRTAPIYEDWYLPENYTLIYATADASDEWCNKMIKQCDKAASIRLKEVVNSPRLKKNPTNNKAPIGIMSIFSHELNACRTWKDQ